jgi:integrase
VYQRCRPGCDPDRCRTHLWSYSVELRPGPDGQRRQLSKGGYETARDAAADRAEIVRLDRAGRLPTDRRITLGEWLPEWLAGRTERGEIRPNTQHAYQVAIGRYLVPKLGHRKLGELRGLEITRVYADIARERREEIDQAVARNAGYVEQAAQATERRAARGLTRPVAAKRVGVPRPVSPTTIERVHACLSAALKAAVKAGLVDTNPCRNATLPKVTRERVTPPAPETYGAFLDRAAGDRLYPLWLLVGHSGLRRGEALGLRWADLDLSSGRLVVSRQRIAVGHQVSETSTKTEAGQGRVVYLDPDTRAALKVWRRRQLEERLLWGPAYQDQGYVFSHEDGQPWHPTAVSKRFARAARRYGLGTTRLHALRHFRASALISNGADVVAVSKTLGHKNIAVTSDIYSHLFDSAAEKLAEIAAGYVPRRTLTTA